MLNICANFQIHSVCYLCHEGLTVAFNFKCKCEQSIGYHCNNQQIYSGGEISIESLTDEEDFAGFEPMSSDLNCNKPKEKMSNEIKAFVCGICQRSYKTKGCLESHIIRHQTKSGQLHCSRCSSRFLVHPHYKSHACI